MHDKITISHRVNNFDFLRFIAASLVIISHSSALTGHGTEPFAWLTRGQETFGGLAVGVFFVISGYLICASYVKTQNIFKYFYARILRIFPALIVVLLIATYLVGSWATSLPLKDYLHNPATFDYLKSVYLYPMRFSLPEVVFSSGKFGTAVNGSLWTLSFEFTCYIMVAILGLLKLLRKEIVLGLFIGALLVHQFQNNIFPNADTGTFFPYINQAQFIKLVTQFLSGMIFYLYKDNIVYSYKYFIIGSFAFIFSCYYGVGYQFLFPTIGAYLIFYLAYCPKIQLQNFSKYGDFSYGIYIYGFMIQQVVIKIFGGNMSNTLNWIISLPIAIVCGVLSWHLVEKRFLVLKK